MWWALTHKTPSPRNHPFYNFLAASARHFPNNLEKCLLNKRILLNKCIPGQLRQLKAPGQGKWPPNILNRRRNIPSWNKHLEETSLRLYVQNLRSHVGIGLEKCLWPHRLRMRPPNTPLRLVMAVRGQRWFSLQRPVQGAENKQIIMANEETTHHLLDCQYTLSISSDEPRSCYPSSLPF